METAAPVRSPSPALSPSPSGDDSLPGRRPAAEAVRALLNEQLLVTLRDGRVVEGALECFDSNGNIVLRDAVDVTREGSAAGSHSLGLVLAPGGSYKSVAVRRSRHPVGFSGISAEVESGNGTIL